VNILTTFDEDEVKSVSAAHLKQRVKLLWRIRSADILWFSDKACLSYGDCRSIDVDGLPNWPDQCTFPTGAA